MAKLPGYRVWRYAFNLLICSAVAFTGYSQGSFRLELKFLDADSASVVNQAKIKTQFNSNLQVSEYVYRLPGLLQANGYLASSIDSLAVSGNITSASLFVGPRYTRAGIRIKPADYELVKEVAGKALRNDLLSFSSFSDVQAKLLAYFDNNGYPFIRVGLDSVQLLNDQITAVVNIDKGIPYRIDSLRVIGTTKISRNFMHRYIGIERGSVYRGDKLGKIDQRLLELPYLQQQQPWDITMLSTGSIVNLYLQPKKSNQVNVLAGFLPASEQNGGKLLFTIDANLQLKNSFGAGESIGIVWQQIQPKSPRLNIQFQLPYVMNSPFGVDFLFDLYKRDSAYLNLNAQFGLLYSFSANQTGKLVIQNQSTTLLEVDTARIKSFKALPDLVDVRSVNVGIDYDVNRTDYRFNPRRGNEFKIFASAGSKKIRKNNTITQLKDPLFNYNKLYDTIQLNTYQLRFKVQGAHYFKTGKQAVLKTAINSGWYESANYSRNELFQIGGYRLLRGFDEESIFSSRYAVATLEYRYLLGLNSYFYGFTDLGWSKDGSIKTDNGKGYSGAGVGLAFESKGGIFNISFAAGKRSDLPFSLRQSKIHIGYVSVF